MKNVYLNAMDKLYWLCIWIAGLSMVVMTLVIQIFVYPDAYPTHGVWMTVLLFLAARGGGVVALDHWLAGRGLTG